VRAPVVEPPELMDRHDAVMLQPAADPRLVLEPRDEIPVIAEPPREHLDREIPSELAVLDAVDRTHSATTEPFDDTEAAEPLRGRLLVLAWLLGRRAADVVVGTQPREQRRQPPVQTPVQVSFHR